MAFLYSGWIKSKAHSELAKENSKYIVAKKEKSGLVLDIAASNLVRSTRTWPSLLLALS